MARTHTSQIVKTIKEHVLPGHGTSIEKLSQLTGIDVAKVRRIAYKLEETKGSGVIVIQHNWIVRFY